MSRPLDQERGARIAAWQADEMLRAHFSPDLFSQRLKPAQVKLWQSIAEAAQDELRDAALLREARAHA